MGTLHITNGDCAAATIRHVVDDPVVIAADVLHEGPCPAVDGQAWHEVRARFLAGYAGTTADDVKAALAGADRAVVDACAPTAMGSAERGEIVLWFEHDLFDQLLLIRTLDLVARLTPRAMRASPRVSLVCIDRFPGVDRFIGLGQLTADELATLIGTAVPITADQAAVASAAWNAFRSPDPSALVEMAVRITTDATPHRGTRARALPFLGDALLRFLAEYPSAVNGLSRTEALALESLLAGPTTADALFAATQANEAAPFMGDLTFFEILQRLASCRVPLVAIDTQPDTTDPRPRRIAITPTGREVIADRADHVRLNGIDLWRGGVHLMGSDSSPWRWDARSQTLVS